MQQESTKESVNLSSTKPLEVRVSTNDGTTGELKQKRNSTALTEQRIPKFETNRTELLGAYSSTINNIKNEYLCHNIPVIVMLTICQCNGPTTSHQI